MKKRRVEVAIFFVVAILVMYNVVPVAASTKSFSAFGSNLLGNTSLDGVVSYTKGYDAYGWPTYRIDYVKLNHVSGGIVWGLQINLLVDVFVWIDDTMIWWINQGPPDMPWASFCIPGTPWTPIIHAAPINDYDIVFNGGGSTSKRTGHKLRVRVRAQVTGWHNLAGANPFFFPPIPFPIVPAICSWEWSIGIYPTGGSGGKTTD